MTDRWDEAARSFFEANKLPYSHNDMLALGRCYRSAFKAGQEDVTKWMPIEQAPKDGTRLLLAKIVGHPDHDTALWWACTGHWSAKWNNWNDGFEPCGLAGPTHFLYADGHGIRPLPIKES